MARIWRGLIVLCAFASAALGPTVVQPAAAAPAGPPVLLLGDSVMAGLHYGNAVDIIGEHYSVALDAFVCRKLVATSCTYQGETPPTAMDVLAANNGNLGQAVVMMAGYNDSPLGPPAAIVMDEFDRQNVPVVLWLTYQSPEGQFDAWNSQLLSAAAAAHPRVRVVDWGGYSAGHSSWFADDGLHLTASGRTALASFITAQLDAVLAAPPDNGCGTDMVPTVPAPLPMPAPTPQRFHAVAPVRVLDTRDGTGVDHAGRRPAHGVLPLSFPTGVVPVGSTAVALTVTVSEPCAPGYVTAYPCAAGPPKASNLNFEAGQVVPNLVLVALDANARVCLLTSAETNVVADLTGYVGADGEGFVAETPRRIWDTRDGTGGRTIPLAAGETVAVAGARPAATAAVVNVTAADPSADGYLTVHPCGASAPTTSNVNYRRGEPAGALAVGAVDANGMVCITSSAASDVAVDVFGGFTAEGGALTVAPPQRVLDTRSTARAEAGAPVTIDLPVPSGTTAALLNLTATEPAADGYAAAYPCDQPPPPTSNVNFSAGDTIANFAAVQLSAGGDVCLITSARTHLVADLSGWVTP